jgi:hypothetical protein
MKIMFRKNKSVRLSVLLLALAAMVAMPSNSSLASAGWKVSSVPLAGVNGGSNNVAFAFDRYVLVAPYAPLNPIDEKAGLELLDNHFLYLVDTKKPSDGALPISIEGFDPTGSGSKTVFYPTRVLFDPASRIVYVRGTRFEKRDDGYEGIQVIAYLHLNLDDNNKPVVTSRAVVFDIKGVGSEEHCGDAPIDFALGQNGKLLVFTNGASIFTYNVDEGYVYKVTIVTPQEFSEDSQIKYLDIDEASDVVTVCWNSQVKGADGIKSSSELSFYHLDPDGTLSLIKRIPREQFPENTSLIAGSGVAITTTGDKADPEFAYFVTSDGSLYQADLTPGGSFASMRQMLVIGELAQGDSADASPRAIKFDPAKRVIGIVKQGFTAQIRRPATGRPGRPGNLIRSLSTFTPVEPPAFALVKLGKKNKVVSSNVFVNNFSAEEGLTNFVPGKDGQWMISTHSGNLYSVANAEDPQHANLDLMTQLGPRTDQIAFCSTRSSVVAINSFEPDASSNQIMSPGSIIIAKTSDAAAQIARATLSSAGATPHGVIARKIVPDLSIRRPCNDRRLN